MATDSETSVICARYFARFSTGSACTLLPRKFSRLAMMTMASTRGAWISCDRSSRQNASAAARRFSGGRSFHKRAGVEHVADHNSSARAQYDYAHMPERLLTPRFATMWSYSFTVFVSLFQLLPAAPYHVIDLGGSTAAAGLFLGLLTYASAFSAPITGAIGDRVGQRRVLITVSLILAAISASYAFMTSYKVMLAVVVVHGLFWSGLLCASSAYMTATIPPSRRAEGLGLLGPRVGQCDRRRARARLLGLSPRLDHAVRRDRRAESDHGGHRVAAAGREPGRPREP